MKTHRSSRRRSQQPKYLVSVLKPHQKLLYWVFVAVWLYALGTFWAWWLQGNHVSTFGFGGMVLNSVLLFWSTVLPGWFFYFAGRMKRPNPKLPLPQGRVAIVVTKAPSEPWEMLVKTLEGMLYQTFPYHYDVWLADEDPSDETYGWCYEHGVYVATRKGLDHYHQQTFPSRTKSKEGNLRYFYENFGHLYDFVVQLDADHVPTETYLVEMIRPFINPRVGYVAAPSICDANAAHSWASRARLYAEAALHGALQAGYNGGPWNPMAIGSHYAVRVAAARDLLHPVKTRNGYNDVLGWLGPELAEDHSTTLAMVANGWRGAFAFDAIAHGDGAESLGDSMTQEFQWSRSLTALLTRWTGGYFKLGMMSKLARFQFLFAQLWYPLFSLHMMMAVLLPLVALLGGFAWVRVPYTEFILRFLSTVVTCLLPLFYLKWLGTFRPHNAKLVSWEGILFTFVRWPWALFGVAQGLISGLIGKELPFKVTAKGEVGRKPFPFKAGFPYVIVVLLTSAVVLMGSTASQVSGYYYLSLASIVSYSLVLVAIGFLHLRENTVKFPLKAGLVGLGLIVITTGAFVFKAPTAIKAIAYEIFPRTVLSPITLAQPTGTGEGIIYGAYDPDDRMDGLQVRHVFTTMRLDDATELMDQLLTLHPGEFPLITTELYSWQGWDGLGDATLLADITRGAYDSSIRTMCGTINQYAPYAWVRSFHEMDIERGGTLAWTGRPAAEFIPAYQHFVTVCREEAPLAKFVWSPAGSPQLVEYWPGAQYVDYVAVTSLSYFQWNQAHFSATEPVSFTQLFGERYALVEQFGKPVIIAEFGICCGDGIVIPWLLDAYSHLADYPLLSAVIYFNALQTDGGWGPGFTPDWHVSNDIFPPRPLVETIEQLS